MKHKPINWDLPVVSCDVETTGFDCHRGHRPFLYGMATEDGDVLIGDRQSTSFKEIKDRLENPGIAKTGHNIRFDNRHAIFDGIKIRGPKHCSLIMAATVNEYEESFKLERLAGKYLGFKDTNAQRLEQWKFSNSMRIRKEYGRELRYSDVGESVMKPYLEDDVVNALQLHYFYRNIVKQHFDELYAWEMRLMEALMRMEDRGVKIDLDYIRDRRRVKKELMTRVLEELRVMTGNDNFDPGNHRHVGFYMQKFGVVVGPNDKTKTGLPKTDKETLGKYITQYFDDGAVKKQGNPFLDKVFEFRSAMKLEGTYFTPMMEKCNAGTIHAHYWQGSSSADRGIRTQRLSASDPNLQNIPIRSGPEVRGAFVPRVGCSLFFLDYTQIEMIVFVDIFRPESMVKAAIAGEDFHSFTGRLIKDMSVKQWNEYKLRDEKGWKEARRIGKECNFAVIYGSGVRTFSETIGTDQATGKRYFDRYHNLFPEIREVSREQMKSLYTKGYVSDRFGRRYHVPRDLAYKSVNAVVQGSAATVLKQAVVTLDDYLQERRETNFERQPREAAKLMEAVARCPFDGPYVSFDENGNDVVVTNVPAGLVNNIHDEIHVECPDTDALIVIPECVRLMRRDDFIVPVKVDMKWSSTSWAEEHSIDEWPGMASALAGNVASKTSGGRGKDLPAVDRTHNSKRVRKERV